MKKQLFLFLLALLPLTVSADESGTCGDNLTWTYVAATQTLTISGSGDMGGHPWDHLRKVIKTVIIEKGVTSISNQAFGEENGDSYAITSISIPNSITHIRYNAFRGCTLLQKVIVSDIAAWCKISINNDNQSFHANPLYYAHHLYADENTEITDLIIPEGVTDIEPTTFSGCSYLTSITFPKSLKSIKSHAFRNCFRLNTIYSLNPTPPTCDRMTFYCSDNIRDPYDVYKYANLHVPMGSKELYASSHDWRYFEKIKEDMQLDGNIYYANLTVQQGTTGYTRQAIKAGETYTIYIGSFGDNRVNAVTFNGIDVTEEIVNGNYTTPEITGESVLCISYEIPSSAPSINLNNVKVMGYQGEITISNIDEPSDINIYSTDGKIADNIPSASGSAKISVTPGQLYVVKVGNRTYKIAL